jgi:hypothetical protein
VRSIVEEALQEVTGSAQQANQPAQLQQQLQPPQAMESIELGET